MELGLFYQLPVSNGQRIDERYRETTAQVVAADVLGFHTAWFAEFHFAQSFSTLASPFLFMASLAPVTSSIRLGTAAVIPALHHPVRLVEEAGMLDVLTGGRLELALGRGGIGSHFEGYQQDVYQRTEKLHEALWHLKVAWHTAHTITGVDDNPYLHHITPLPVQQPHPPITVVANSESTALLAAQHHYHCMINSVVNPFNDRFFELASIYHEQSVQAQMSAVVPVLITENKTMKENVIRSFSKYLGSSPSHFQEYARDRAITGTLSECVEQIEALQAKANLKQLICWFNPGGLIPHEQVIESMTLLMSTVNVNQSIKNFIHE